MVSGTRARPRLWLKLRGKQGSSSEGVNDLCTVKPICVKPRKKGRKKNVIIFLVPIRDMVERDAVTKFHGIILMYINVIAIQSWILPLTSMEEKKNMIAALCHGKTLISIWVCQLQTLMYNFEIQFLLIRGKMHMENSLHHDNFFSIGDPRQKSGLKNKIHD